MGARPRSFVSAWAEVAAVHVQVQAAAESVNDHGTGGHVRGQHLLLGFTQAKTPATKTPSFSQAMLPMLTLVVISLNVPTAAMAQASGRPAL